MKIKRTTTEEWTDEDEREFWNVTFVQRDDGFIGFSLELVIEEPVEPEDLPTKLRVRR